MFRSIFTKSLRDYRVAILGWGIGLGLLVYFYFATVLSQLADTSGTQLQQIAGQFNFFGEVVKANTPGGFITFKIMGTLPLILGVWAILAGARMTRGEEESGALDIILSTPQSRLSVFIQKALALAAATGLLSLLMGLLIIPGMASAKLTPDPVAALLAAFNAGIVVYLFGALALLLAQFMSRGAAAGWAGALMALFFILDATGRAVNGASGLRPFSPFYYYNRNLPLVPDFPTNWGALALLVALCVVLVGVAATALPPARYGPLRAVRRYLRSRAPTCGATQRRSAREGRARGMGPRRGTSGAAASGRLDVLVDCLAGGRRGLLRDRRQDDREAVR